MELYICQDKKYSILSTAQLENQGFSIHWPPNYGDIEHLCQDDTVCTVFHRINGRLMYNPNDGISKKAQLYPVKRDWHNILGHPGQKAQDAMLKFAEGKGYKFPFDCEICSKAKITKSKGHGSLRNASTFGEAIHMDFVGGQKSLFPTTTDNSVPHATWFLLAVD